VDQRRLSVSIKLGRGGDGRSSVFEQAGKYGRDASVGRTSWEGWQAETRTPDAIDPKRAPAEAPLQQLGLSYGDSAGARWEYCGEMPLISACPLPSLFDPLRRPATLPSFVRPT